MARKYQRLLNKQVLVFGGTSGIGFGVAEACLEAGAQVIITSSSPERVAAKVEELTAEYPSSTVSGIPCDLSRPTLEQDLEALFAQIGGLLDHIVFTACDQLQMVPWRDITLDFWTKSGHMRLAVQFFVGKIGSRHLRPGPDSSITFTSGTSAEKPAPGWGMVGSYAAGLKALTRNMALDLKPIRVNIVSPGYVNTEMWQKMDAAVREPIFDHLRKTLPTAAVPTPVEVAEAYLWLMKDANVTGTCAETNAGMKLI